MQPRNNSPRLQRIHAYAASFGEDLSRELISNNTQESDTILDPFAGAGTSVLESILINRNAIGIDVDPIACRISRVLTSRFDVPYLIAATNHLQERLRNYEEALLANPSICTELSPGAAFELDGLVFTVPNEPAIAYWFDPSHMATLSIICNIVAEETDFLVRQALEVAVSSSIIRKWPNTLSYAMDIDHSRPHKPQGVVAQPIQKQFTLFNRTLLRARDTILNIQDHLTSLASYATILEGDSEDELSLIGKESINFILTSPPYLNAIDYPRAHKFSHWWLSSNDAPLQRSEYIGLRSLKSKNDNQDTLSIIPSVSNLISPFSEMPIYRNILRYIVDIAGVIGQVYRVLMNGSTVVFVVADNVIAKTVFPVSAIICELFKRAGFTSVTMTNRPIKSTRRRYPFGSHGFSGPMHNEYLVKGVKV